MTFFQTVIIALAVIQLLSELLLKKKNEARINSLKSDPPSEINGIMDFDTWKKTSNYSLDKSKFSSLSEILGFLFFVPIFLLFFPWFFSQWSTSSEMGILTCAFTVCAFLTVLQIPSLPLDWYQQFKLEEKYGFNKSTIKLWVSDKIKGTLLGFGLGVVLLSILIFLFREISKFFPNYWWVISFIVFFGIQLLLMIIWPKVILPIFNKLSPLEDGDLKKRLLSLADRTGFKAKSIEVIDGSKRSGHSNAFFTGFGKYRRIVLYDTLLNQMNHEEVEAVLAHEVGHYIKGHIPKRLFISFLSGLAFFGLVAFSVHSPWLYLQSSLPLNLEGSLSSIIVLFSMTMGFFTYWISPVSNLFSRKHEFEADAFAKASIGGETHLIEALRKLYRENLTHPLPHPWIATFHFSHPTILERERALRA